jgi:hypothetical protein
MSTQQVTRVKIGGAGMHDHRQIVGSTERKMRGETFALRVPNVFCVVGNPKVVEARLADPNDLVVVQSRLDPIDRRFAGDAFRVNTGTRPDVGMSLRDLHHVCVGILLDADT